VDGDEGCEFANDGKDEEDDVEVADSEGCADCVDNSES